MAVKEDFRSLTGVQKAAIFMLAIGQEYSSWRFYDQSVRTRATFQA